MLTYYPHVVNNLAMKTLLAASFLVFGLGAASAQSYAPRVTIAHVDEHHTPVKHWAWIGSMGFLAAGQMMDWQSSLGKHEANPIIGNSGGQFNASRGLSLKLAIVGGAIGSEVIMHHFAHSHNADMIFTGANTMLGGIGAMVAVHNYGVKKVAQ